jgi:hypothetical protein
MPRPLKPVDLINDAARKGAAVARFKIDRADGLRIKKLEQRDPQAALAELLRILRTPRQ